MCSVFFACGKWALISPIGKGREGLTIETADIENRLEKVTNTCPGMLNKLERLFASNLLCTLWTSFVGEHQH